MEENKEKNVKDNLNKDKDKDKENNNKEKKETFPSKEISDFISIIDQASLSLPDFLKSIKTYFCYLETRITFMIQQINNSINYNFAKENININIIEENNLKDDLFTNLKQKNQLNKYVDYLNNYQKIIDDKNKELLNLINDTIIKEIKKQLEKYKYEKIKIFSKFQCLINDITILKKNID